MMDAVLAFVRRQYVGRKTIDEMLAIASAMLDLYYSDAEYYGGYTLMRLHDAAIEKGRT